MNRPQNNPQTRTATLATVIAALVLIATGACGDGTGSPTGPSPTRPTGSLRIDGLPGVGIAVGETVQLTATIIASDGATRTAPASWSTTSPERLDITQHGQATGKLPGQARITAEAEGLTRHADTEVHDPRLDDQFWREFAFDDWDCIQGRKTAFYCDEPVEQRRLTRLPVTSPNVEIVTGTISPRLERRIRTAMPQTVQQLTGQTYTGRIRAGAGEARDNWIVIEGVATGETARSASCRGQRIPDNAVGAANVGAIQGCIMLNTSKEQDLGLSTVMHEIGHAMGFRHVGDPGSIMSITRARSLTLFSFKEQKHGQFAYTQPRGATYAEISLNSFGLRPPQSTRSYNDDQEWVYD